MMAWSNEALGTLEIMEWTWENLKWTQHIVHNAWRENPNRK